MGDGLGARLREVLVENAVDSPANQGLHGWRCQYPDRYGPCDCFDELVSELMAAISDVRSDVRRSGEEGAWPTDGPVSERGMKEEDGGDDRIRTGG